MDQRLFVAQLNIEHYRWKLNGVLDDAQRRLIGQLLEEEEAKLVALRASIAERYLSQLLDLLAHRANNVFDVQRTRTDLRKGIVDLAATFDRMPCAISLIDRLGTVVLMNDSMGRFMSSEIPSRDPPSCRHWRVFDGEGRPMSPVHWPGAKALVGESVNPGLAAIYTARDGQETAVRIAAIPVSGHNGSTYGAVAAVYEMATLERDEVHELLEQNLGEERSREKGQESSAR